MKHLLRTPTVAACALGVCALLSAACDPPPAVVPRTAPTTTSASHEPAFTDPGVFPSKRFGMRVRLPRSAGWKIDDTTSRWLSATQSAEGSSLLIRLWRSENRMTRDKCEARARSFRNLPSRVGAEILTEEVLDTPPGFDTHAHVGVLPDSKGGIFGFILAFGGSGRKCFSYVYVTRAEGPGADSVVADRLAEMTEGSLRTLTFESDLEGMLDRDTESPVD